MGGAERYLVRLVNRLDRRCFESWIVYTNGDVVKKELAQDVGIIKLQEEKATARNPFDWLNIIKFYRLMKELKTDLVHTQGAGIFCIAAWIAAKLLRIPVVHTIQHTYAARSRTEDITIKTPGLRNFLYSLVDAHIAGCEYMKREFIGLWKIPPQRVYLDPIGIDLNQFKPLAETVAKKKLREELGIESDVLIIGVVARLCSVKGVHKAMSILPRVKKEIPKIKLVIVGDGPMRKDYEKLVDALDLRRNVLFTGLRTDVSQLMNMFDVYLQTTDAPLIGFTTLEAMATGKPLVTLVQNKEEEDMARETVVEGGNGILIPLGDQEAVTRLVKLLKNKRVLNEMGESSRKLAEQKFDLRLHIQNMESLYEDLICMSKK